MPLHQVIQLEQGRVGVWHVSEPVDELHRLACPSPSELLVLNQFRTESRKKEWLAVRATLMSLLGEKHEILYGSSGKPYLIGYCIGITHTRNYVAVSVSTQPTAVDLEYPSDRVLRIAPRFMGEADWTHVAGVHDREGLLLIWSAKEVLYKYYDAQGVLFDQHLSVVNRTGSAAGVLVGHIAYEKQTATLEMRYVIAPHYLLVYC